LRDVHRADDAGLDAPQQLRAVDARVSVVRIASDLGAEDPARVRLAVSSVGSVLQHDREGRLPAKRSPARSAFTNRARSFVVETSPPPAPSDD